MTIAAVITALAVAIAAAVCASRRTPATPVVESATAAPAPAAAAPIRPRPADHFRKGEAVPQRTGRAARIRIGHHMSVARRHAVLDALCARVNGGRLTAAAYLSGVLGADERFVRSYASPFGRAVARAFRQAHGCEPARDGLARHGRRLMRCFTYDEAALAAGALAYARTAELVAA